MNLYNQNHPATKKTISSILSLKLMVLLLALTTGVVGQYQSHVLGDCRSGMY